MYLLVYLDDLILTSNQESQITYFTTHLNQKFAIKDFGDLNYFISLEASYTDCGLFLCHSKYAKDVLTRANLLDSEPIPMLLATHEIFTSNIQLFSDPTLYHSLVGALQYLNIT